MKSIVITFVLYVSTVSIGFTDELVESDTLVSKDLQIKSVYKANDLTFLVICQNNTNGSVSIEENQICTFSEDNNKNFCNLATKWTLDDALSYVCSQPSAK